MAGHRPARECIFGRGQDLGWSLAFYGEEADWEGPSGFPVVPLYPPPPSLLAAQLGEHGCPRGGSGGLFPVSRSGDRAGVVTLFGGRVGPTLEPADKYRKCHILPLSPNNICCKLFSCTSPIVWMLSVRVGQGEGTESPLGSRDFQCQT